MDTQTIPLLTADDINPTDIEAIASARIPLSQNPRKANYLSYRALDFSIREACMLAEVTQATLNKWRREDEEFFAFERDRLAFLQSSVAQDVTRAKWMRCFFLALRRDESILYKANYNFEGLTEHERSYLHLIRKHYTPQDLLALEKALEPEHGERVPIEVDKAIFIVDGQEVKSEEAKRAAARALLGRFSTNVGYAELESGNGSESVDGDSN